MRLIIGLIFGAIIFVIAFPSNVVARTFCVNTFSNSDNLPVARDTLLAQAVETVFGPHADLRPHSNESCIGVKLLSYSDADVLISDVSGGDCHVCAGTLSAYVLLSRQGHLRLVSTIKNFYSGGGWGVAGDFATTYFAGHDAIILKETYASTGDSITQIMLFTFSGSGITNLTLQPIVIAADNFGASPGPKDITSITGDYFISPPGKISMQYVVINNGIWRVVPVDWALSNGQLQIDQGAVPSEIDQLR